MANQYQQLAAKHYQGGELEDYIETPEAAGDTLFLFLMRELSDAEDCDSLETALDRVARAILDLQTLFHALENLS